MGNKERADLKGTVLDGRYRVGGCIGVGGTGVVFRARVLGRPEESVVLKTLRPAHAADPDLVRRLWREAEVARKVRHPGIVPVLDEGTLPDGSPYLVMPLLRGESALRLIRRQQQVDPAQASAIVIRAAAILHAVHSMGYVHRDIKPEHVLLDANPDGTLQVHLLDFGVCAAESAPADERTRERGRVYGTPSYASPEQACGDPFVDGRADVWGLGVLLFELLTGSMPYSAGSVQQLLRQILDEDAPPAGRRVADLPVGMDQVVSTALARDRAHRYPSVRALARALTRFAAPRLRAERQLAAGVNGVRLAAPPRPIARQDAVA